MTANESMVTERLQAGRSTLVNRNVTVRGKRTSVRLEPPMWDALEEICQRERKLVNQFVTEIDDERSESSLTAAIRVSIMRYYRHAATESGHARAGHGTWRHPIGSGRTGPDSDHHRAPAAPAE